MDKIKINTKFYGEMEVSPKQKITFVEGIFAFWDYKEYYLIDTPQKDNVFYVLQSKDDINVAFILIQPQMFKPDYKLEVSKADLDAIGVNTIDDVIYFSIVTIPADNPEEMSANLVAPIIINKHTRLAKQAISLNQEYSTKHYIMKEIKGK